MSSVLLEHTWDNNSSYKHIVHHCEFNVKTRSKWLYGASSGLFVAIRELRFRQNIVGECIDYVIFELNDVVTPTSHKVCGTIFGEESVRDMRNYFDIPEGFLKIIIHIGYHNMEPNEIAMKLTFTAFEGVLCLLLFLTRSSMIFVSSNRLQWRIQIPVQQQQMHIGKSIRRFNHQLHSTVLCR